MSKGACRMDCALPSTIRESSVAATALITTGTIAKALRAEVRGAVARGIVVAPNAASVSGDLLGTNPGLLGYPYFLHETPRDIPVEFSLDRKRLQGVFDTILTEGSEILSENVSKPR